MSSRIADVYVQYDLITLDTLDTDDIELNLIHARPTEAGQMRERNHPPNVPSTQYQKQMLSAAQG